MEIWRGQAFVGTNLHFPIRFPPRFLLEEHNTRFLLPSARNLCGNLNEEIKRSQAFVGANLHFLIRFLCALIRTSLRVIRPECDAETHSGLHFHPPIIRVFRVIRGHLKSMFCVVKPPFPHQISSLISSASYKTCLDNFFWRSLFSAFKD